MAEVLCFGEALIDMLAEPAGAGPLRFQRHAGGAPANVAVALAKLGTPVAFIGMLARDAFGDFLLQSLAEAGVATHLVRRTADANTALAFVTLDDQGERRFSFYRPPAADLLFRREHFQADAFATAAAFHICSNSLTDPACADATLEGVRLAQSCGALVSFDVNYRAGLWPTHADARPRIWSLLREADVVKLSSQELRYLAEPMRDEQAVVDELWRGHARWLLITDGSGPMRSLTREKELPLDAFKVDCINATGAGDAFVAGILDSLSEFRAEDLDVFLADEVRIHKALRFAAACGALAVTRHGAFEAMPTRAEVATLLANQP
ncbi:MAG TPA: carbohydrate kinase [Gammaproteobacteria bacterium]|nr:carbohydrate kinase [Gammaproteobacteria bacterium]